MLSQETLKELTAGLENEKNKIINELKEIATPNREIKGDWIAKFPKFDEDLSGSSTSLEEEQDEVEEYEVRLEAEHSLESRLLEISKALERLHHGTYGVCTTCKKEIPLERLRANPAAEFDIEHQS